MRIVFLASECSPFAKTGGLADVIGALPLALHKLGHEVMVVMPKYAMLDYDEYGLNPYLSPLGVWMGDTEEWCSVHRSDITGIPTYFIESNKYFDRWGLYHDADYNDYQDNPRRFGLLTRAGLQLCRELGFRADIVHTHDWQTALGAAYLKVWHWNDPILGSAASLLTIHNIAYQGVYSAEHYPYLGLQWGNFTSQKFEDHGQINFLKGGIHYSDLVNTVSPTYARETRTPELGFGLAPYLNDRGDTYFGILNGVDYTVWDPAVDRLIPERYTSTDLAGKAVCKRALQHRFLLEPSSDTLILAVISRLVAQKGLDLLRQVLEDVLGNMRVQVVVLGAGEKDLEAFFGDLPKRYPGRVGCYIGYHNELSHWIEAGADLFVMPSRYEPCGLNQIYSLRYGTLPLVRATGGLDDTVQQYDERTGAGTGFKFWDATPAALYYTIGWAVSTYYDRPQHWRKLVQAAMKENFSWERSAAAYVTAYERALKLKKARDSAL